MFRVFVLSENRVLKIQGSKNPVVEIEKENKKWAMEGVSK